MRSVLITGSNRGMGLEWVRQYAADGWRVYATCRFPQQADDLQRLAADNTNISMHRLDVTRADDVQNIADELSDASLDILINNAGIYREKWGRDKLGRISYEDWQETFNVNTLGAMRVSEALANNLARADKRLIVAISSHMGSIAETAAPNDYAYRSSKAAMNAAFKGLSLEVAAKGIGVLLLHPGWVRTRMGGDGAPLSVEESVTGMRRILARYKTSQSGCFYRYDGSEIPW